MAPTTRGEHVTGSELDVLQDTCDFFGSGIGYLFLKNIGSGQDQNICLISITRFHWEWFKMLPMMQRWGDCHI